MLAQTDRSTLSTLKIKFIILEADLIIQTDNKRLSLSS